MKKKNKPRTKAGTSKAAAAHRKALFIEAYVTNGGNATQAAITAGFSKNRARAQGSELVADRNIFAEIERRRATVRQEAMKITGLTAERHLREVARLSYSDIRKFFKPNGAMSSLDDLDDDTAACISSIEVDEITVEGAVIGLKRKLKLWDKNAALEKGMKHLGLYAKDNEQKPLLGNVSIQVVGVEPAARR